MDCGVQLVPSIQGGINCQWTMMDGWRIIWEREVTGSIPATPIFTSTPMGSGVALSIGETSRTVPRLIDSGA